MSDTTATPDHDTGWARVHPATPLLRSWQLFVVGLVVVGQDFGESLVFGGDGGFAAVLTEHRLVGAAVTVGVLAATAGGAWLSWHRIRYRVTASALEFEQGVVFRRQRRAPLDRLQAVDLTEPLLARLVGLAKLTLEVAGGGNSKIEIAFLPRSDCLDLRDHLLSAASGVTSGVGSEGAIVPQVGRSPERNVVTVPTGRLLASTLLSGAPLTLTLIAASTLVVAVSGEIRILAFAGVAIVVIAAGTWSTFVRSFEFRVAEAADGVRVRRGLFEQRTQTVPPGRVQAVRLSQPLLWRPMRWWRVEVNIAGYGIARGDQADTDTVLLPVGTGAEARAVLGFVLSEPETGIGTSAGIDDDVLAGRGAQGGFVAAPNGARWVDPIAWRRRGFRVDPSVLLLRGGRLRRHLDVVPHARAQSSAVRRGPLQRRLDLATFELHSTPGPIRPRVGHLRADVIIALAEDQAVRARAQRAVATDEWLAAPAGDAPATG